MYLTATHIKHILDFIHWYLNNSRLFLTSCSELPDNYTITTGYLGNIVIAENINTMVYKNHVNSKATFEFYKEINIQNVDLIL